jgi:hypothetical protein
VSAPWPKTEQDLLSVIRSAFHFEWDESDPGTGYEASANALVTCAVAAFNYACSVVGATGFQASWAELEFIRRSRGFEGPFAILDATRLLYPQYDGEWDEMIKRWRVDLAPVARQKIEACDRGEAALPSPRVEARWRELAALDGAS